jgi:ferredoxin
MYSITRDCHQCGYCIIECPVDAIVKGPEIHHILPDKCVDCGQCAEVCPVDAVIRVLEPIGNAGLSRSDPASPAAGGR